MKTTAIIIVTILITVMLSTYLHDKNVLNQCNSRGYTDALVVGERLSCLETE